MVYTTLPLVSSSTGEISVLGTLTETPSRTITNSHVTHPELRLQISNPDKMFGVDTLKQTNCIEVLLYLMTVTHIKQALFKPGHIKRVLISCDLIQLLEWCITSSNDLEISILSSLKSTHNWKHWLVSRDHLHTLLRTRSVEKVKPTPVSATGNLVSPDIESRNLFSRDSNRACLKQINDMCKWVSV